MCALQETGAVICSGNNEDGQLGDGTTLAKTSPTSGVGLSDLTSLASGDYHTCATRRNGSIVCWGNNESGELGDGTTEDRTTPVTVL
jgi:alpha-tubulin suppressor-like RCC1 family protein